MNIKTAMLASALLVLTAGCEYRPGNNAGDAALSVPAKGPVQTTGTQASKNAASEAKVTVSQHKSHQPVQFSFTAKTQIGPFLKAVSSATAIPGVLDVAAPDFDMTVTTGNETKQYSLWLRSDSEQGMIMDPANTHTGYSLTADDTGKLKKLLADLLNATTAFGREQAVTAVLKEYPEFPQPGEVKDIEVTTGGPAPGTKVKGTLRTKVEAAAEPDAYVVTLQKRWDLKINDQELKGIWTYKVTPRSVSLIASEDNTDLVHTVK